MRGPSVVVAVAALVALGLPGWGPTGSATATAGPAASDPLAVHQWALDRIGAPAAWPAGTGSGVVVAVVDTGVDLAHPELAGKVVTGIDLVDGDRDPQDCLGHGTHVAGIVAAATGNGQGVAGTAPGALIMPVRVLDCRGVSVADDALGDGIRWAADHGADVINVSAGDALGQGVFGPSFADAIRHAWSKGAVPVVAAGNDYVTGSGFAEEPALVVSATDREDRKPAYSSGVGSAQWGMAAPGGAGSALATEEQQLRDDVLSTWWSRREGSTYATLAGTSMAAPHVAGAAAVLRGLGLGQEETVGRLIASAADIGTAGRDAVFGHGRLDLAAAVGQPEGTSPAPSPAPSSTPATTPPPPTTAPAVGTTPPREPTRSGGDGGGPATTATTGAAPGAPTTSPPGTVARPPAGFPQDDERAAAPPTTGDGSASRAGPVAAAATLAAAAAVSAAWWVRTSADRRSLRWARRSVAAAEPPRSDP